MQTQRLTVAQAIILYLKNQYVQRDGAANAFFEGCFGIFGHGNVSGIGQALQQDKEFKYIMTRNEQASVHMAAAWAKMKNRMSTWVCTSSIGPGATNMVTGAAAATINRLPVLILAGDIFARRHVNPLLQQLESDSSQDISVNDCFKPVSRYWDRINRPEQIISSLPAMMRVLVSPSHTGTVTLALPQDVQAEAFDFPVELFEPKTWRIERPRPDIYQLQKATEMIKESKRPVIVAGGGVIYSGGSESLLKWIEQTGLPVSETFAGKGAIPFDHPLNLGATGVTGTPGAAQIAAQADLVIGVGTRYSDFTTASDTAFQNPDVKFININIASFDAFKKGALSITADAKVCMDELADSLVDYHAGHDYTRNVEKLSAEWLNTVRQIVAVQGKTPVRQAEVIGTLNEFAGDKDVLVCAAGSLPGDLHKLWNTRNNKGFHLEYGYSTMGYEVAAGMAVKMADPSREVWVMVGDGNYLMMSSELATAIEQGVKYNILLLNNHGFSSIGALSESIGSQRFGTQYQNGKNGFKGVDFAMHAKSMGAHVITATDIPSLKNALQVAKKQTQTTVIVIETDLYDGVSGYAWWDVPVAEVSEMESVQKARSQYLESSKKQRYFL